MKKLLVSLLVLLTITPAMAYQSGNYENFSQSYWMQQNGGSHQLFQNPAFNFSSSYVFNLKNRNSVIGVLPRVFPEISQKGSYEEESVFTYDLVNNMIKSAGEVGCLEWRYRNAKPATTKCGASYANKRNVEKFPFRNPPYKSQRMSVASTPSRGKFVSFESYLEAGNKYQTDDFWYPIHEVGTFFGNQSVDSKSLILTMNLNAYYTSETGRRQEAVFSGSLAYFLILPKSTDIAKQKSESAARKYVENNAQLIVFDF